MTDQAHEEIVFDHIEKMEEFIRPERFADEVYLTYINGMGRIREGRHFSNCRYGYVNFSLGVTLRGCGKFTWRGQEVELKQGDAIFHNNMDYSGISADDEEWAFVYFNIYGEPCRMYERLWNGDGVGVIHLANPAIVEEYYHSISRVILQPGVESELEIHRQLNDMLVSFLVERARASADFNDPPLPAWIAEATSYISDHYRDGSVSTIADRLFLSRVYFARQFKKYTGRSPKEYQTLCRMNAAAALLRNSAFSIAEIAEQTGFSTQSLFAKVFRQAYGQTPSEYRKNGSKK